MQKKMRRQEPPFLKDWIRWMAMITQEEMTTYLQQRQLFFSLFVCFLLILHLTFQCPSHMKRMIDCNKACSPFYYNDIS